MENIKNKQKKDLVQFYTSLGVLIAGIVMVFLALFIQPVGVIHYTVITVFGMFLTFVGAVWQLDVKYAFKTEELKEEIRQRIQRENENRE